MLILPVSPHLISEILDDLPIRLAVLERFKDLIEALNPPLRAGEGTFLFQAGRSRQHNVGVAAGITEKKILNEQELEPRGRIANKILVLFNKAHRFSYEIHYLELPTIEPRDPT